MRATVGGSSVGIYEPRHSHGACGRVRQCTRRAAKRTRVGLLAAVAFYGAVNLGRMPARGPALMSAAPKPGAPPLAEVAVPAAAPSPPTEQADYREPAVAYLSKTLESLKHLHTAGLITDEEWAKARAKTLGEINAGAVQSPSDVAAANELKRQEAAEAELASASAASGSGQSDDALAAAVYESRSQMTRLGDEVHLSNRASPPKSGRSAGGDVNSSELVAASYLGMSTNNPLAVTMSPVQGIAGSARFSTCAPADTLASLRYSTKMSFPMVMESQPATCNVFGGSTFCDEFSSGTAGNIPVDQPLTSMIATFLSDCISKTPVSCKALDIGASMGAMTSTMLATGAQVTAIEPQTDLSQLVWATACLNGWSKRLSMYNNAVTTVQEEAGTLLQLGNKNIVGAWGSRPDGSRQSTDAATKSAKKVFIDQVVGSTQYYAVVKIDTDSVDDEVTKSLLAMLDAGKLSVTTFMVEEPSPELCLAMQKRHGYSMYITQNPHTQFKPQLQWIQTGSVTQLTVKLNLPSSANVTVWKIAPNLSENTWRALLSKNTIQVINMLMTKASAVIDIVSSPVDNVAALLAAKADTASLNPWPVRAGNTPPPPFKYWSNIDSAPPLPAIFEDGALRAAPFAATEATAVDFGACRPFDVNHGKLYRGLMPDGTRAPGQVYLRCSKGYVLAAGMNPERICAAKPSTTNRRDELMAAMDNGTLVQTEDGLSWIRATQPGMVAKWIPGDALGRWYGQQEMCVKHPVARLSLTQSSGMRRSRKCFEDLFTRAAAQPDLRPASMQTMKKLTLFGQENSISQEQERSLFGRGSDLQQPPSRVWDGDKDIILKPLFNHRHREYQQRPADKFVDKDAISKEPRTFFSGPALFQGKAKEMRLTKACVEAGGDESECHAAFHDNNPRGNRRQLQPGDGYRQQLRQLRDGLPLDRSRDYRSQALQCLGCRARPGDATHDCSKDGRLFELGELKCSEKEGLGLVDGGDFCITEGIAAAGDDPCIILTIGVGYIWSVEQDLAHRWNCTVYMFDPTPTSGLGTVPPRHKTYKMQYDASKRTRPFGIWMDHIGIAAASTQAPMVHSQQFGNDKVTDLSFLTVDEILKRIGHQDGSKVALLKLDVEGYEFEVDAAGNTTVFEQILDQRFPYINVDLHTWDHLKLARAVAGIEAKGYRVETDSITARLDSRPAYGTLINLDIMLER